MIVSTERFKLKAKFFRGFSDPTRLAILEYLIGGEAQASNISESLNQSKSNISNHLSCLLDCGLLRNRRDGRKMYYSIRVDKVKEMLENSDAALKQVYDEITACVRYG